jgi:hypothetical protein
MMPERIHLDEDMQIVNPAESVQQYIRIDIFRQLYSECSELRRELQEVSQAEPETYWIFKDAHGKEWEWDLQNQTLDRVLGDDEEEPSFKPFFAPGLADVIEILLEGGWLQK